MSQKSQERVYESKVNRKPVKLVNKFDNSLLNKDKFYYASKRSAQSIGHTDLPCQAASAEPI